MKYLLHTLFYATVLLCSCRKETAEPIAVGMGELTLNASLDGMPISQTRAAETDTNLNTVGFYLAGYHTDGNMESSIADAYPNVFNHAAEDAQAPVPLVTLLNNKFTLKTIKWALNETTYLRFFGWSQSNKIPTSGITAATTGIIAYTKESTDIGYPWIDIRNANAPADQTDIVGARSDNHINDAVLSAVDLNFQHLLSKLTFKAKSSSKANIVVTAVNIKYATNKVYKKARYTFGNEVTAIGAYGTYAEFHSGNVVLKTGSMTMTGGSVVDFGSTLLLPQALAAGDVSLEIKYKLSPNSGNLPGIEQTKTLPLSAFDFEPGKNYVYTIDVRGAGILIMENPIIEPWVISGTSLPIISGPKGNTQLLLDGYDKPYRHADGTMYWLDRSGYNRHVALGAGYVSYDSSKHGYLFTRAYKGGVIPDIGSLSMLTVDVVSECTGTEGNQQPFRMGGCYLQAPFQNNNGNVDWNYAGGYVRWVAPSWADVAKLNFWSVTFISANTRAKIYYNSFLKAEINNSNSVQQLTTNSVAPAYDGLISYLRVTSEEQTAQDIMSTYIGLNQRFDIKNGLPDIAGPKGDVQLLLLGDKTPVSYDGKLYWLDYSGYNRHVLLCDRYASYDSTNKCYKFNQSGGGVNPFGAMIPPLGTGENITISLITENPSGTNLNMAFNLSSKSSFSIADKSTAQLRMLIPYISQIFIYSRANPNNPDNAWQAWVGNDGDAVYRKRSFYTMVSTPSRMAAYRNGTVLGNISGSFGYKIGDLKFNSLAPEFEGSIFMVKITRKEQSDAEIQSDYATYKRFIP